MVTISGYMDVPAADEDALKHAVARQPVSVAICASTLQFYFSGVVNSCCEDLNHGVLVVGYGTDDRTRQDYWIVKNSWGSFWGEEVGGTMVEGSLWDLYYECYVRVIGLRNS